jgi:phosphatidylinositol alpha-1,6-mannosyltransferase
VRRPTLLLLTPDFPPAVGGIQNLLGELCERIAANWDVTVVAPADRSAAATDAATPATVLRTRTRWGGRRSPVVLAEMGALARRLGADVTVAGHLAALPVADAVARLHGRRPVAYLYGSELWTSWGQSAARLCASSVEQAIAISRYTGEQARKIGFPAERTTVVTPGAKPPAVPEDSLRRLSRLGLLSSDGNPVPYLVTVARLAEPHKGHDRFLRCVGPLAARVPGFRWVVVGDGGLRPQLMRAARAYGLGDAVRWTGESDEPTKAALVQNARAFLMISRESPEARQFEGYGIAYVEAALLGVPSIAGRSGGVPDAVIDDVTGVLVDPESAERTVAACLGLLEDEAAARALGESARQYAERHQTWGPAVAQVDRTLRAVAG